MPVSVLGFGVKLCLFSFTQPTVGAACNQAAKYLKLNAYITEDNPTIRRNLIAALEELAEVSTVGTADNEFDSVAWLQQNSDSWNLAIVDLFLNKGSGLGVLEACRNRRPNQKIVVLSNYATQDMRNRCAQVGVDAVFDKSHEIEALIGFCISLRQSLNQSADF